MMKLWCAIFHRVHWAVTDRSPWWLTHYRCTKCGCEHRVETD